MSNIDPLATQAAQEREFSGPGQQAHLSSHPSTSNVQSGSQSQQHKKRRHRGNKRRRHRRPSFAVDTPTAVDSPSRRVVESPQVVEENEPESPERRRPQFYRAGRLGGMNLSDTSLESEALLDHRNQPMMRPRRESKLAQSIRPEPPQFPSGGSRQSKYRRQTQAVEDSGGESEGADDRTPLIRPMSIQSTNFVRYGTEGRDAGQPPRRPPSLGTSPRTSPPKNGYDESQDYDVNNPPSVPGSPKLGPQMGFDDVTRRDFASPTSPVRKSVSTSPRDAVINMNGGTMATHIGSAPCSPALSQELKRRRTVTLPVEEDVCFPTGALSDLGEEEFPHHPPVGDEAGGKRRRRRRVWPDLSVLEEWSREEKEVRSEGTRAKRISEPMLVGGRLRPRNLGWKREEEEAPYRFTYFNEEFHSTIHSQTISELVQPGQSFKELFIPDPPELDLTDEDEEDEYETPANGHRASGTSSGWNGRSHTGSHASDSREISPRNRSCSPDGRTEKRYGPRPTFWLDVLSPTDAEMRVIAKAFGIHALTAEDIMMQEAREKVELFRHYYFINYRTFDQDSNSDNFLQPVDMYVIVFREGVLSFHFSMVPHPANVRRRIRQLKDYLILNSDWISYAIIDDITDVFGPLIQSIEDEVDDIDDTILRMHSDVKELEASAAQDSAVSGSDMLRRVGECRKKVMGLYRLLGNKADVIKGFAKRCNEQWEVAPKSEIGLYLGDIQDHILTMTSNLTHYETLLSRAHSNYLAQINIRMNERQEQTADVLGKLTVLGTIVLPMNIICGMWGMNVKVPGQDIDNLYWFWSITAGLFCFAMVCYVVAKRVYGIV